jgi:hypothetical protein
MPDWSPVRTFGGYGAWADADDPGRAQPAQKSGPGVRLRPRLCIHGHDHATAWSSRLPIADLESFWGALGCACWAL